jgi:hypothetical protein
MAGQFTYLVGLLIFGALLGAVGLIAAERERRRSRGHANPSQMILPLPERGRGEQAAHAP